MGHGVADLEHSVPPDNYGFSGFAKKNRTFVGTCRRVFYDRTVAL